MNNKPSRNDVCHCGSGKKYKVCHGQSNNKSYQLLGLSAVIVLALLWFFFYEPELAPLPVVVPNRLTSPIEAAPPGKVWSVEHGHWHDASSFPAPSPLKPTPSPTSTPSRSKPPGEAPPGKIWSPEHGHWHDIQ